MKYISDKATIIDPCFIGHNVYIGPYSIIGPNVHIKDNNWIDSHVIIRGKCHIGSGNKFFKFVNIGVTHQFLRYEDFSGNLIIGNNNIFMEGSKIANKNNCLTIIGNNNYFMTNSKISHGCILRNNIVFANRVSIAEYVFVGNFVVLSEFVNVNQNVLLGDYSFAALRSVIYKDVLPYTHVIGHPAKLKKLNLVWLKKNGFNIDRVFRLKKIYKLIFESNLTVKQIVFLLSSKKYESIESEVIVNFLLKSERGIVR